jgi:hypothetical protein
MKRIIGLLVVLLVALPLVSMVVPQPVNAEFYAKVDVQLAVSDSLVLDFGSKNVISIAGAAEPPGFKLEKVVVVFEDAAPPQIVPVKYATVSQSMGKVKSIASDSGEVVLASNGFNGTVSVRVLTYFVKTYYEKLGDGNLTVDTSEFSGLGIQDVILKVTIDNYAPYGIAGVIGPNGDNLMDLGIQERLGAGIVKVDPKHVEINVGRVGFGKYTITVAKGEEKVMPNALLVVEDTFTEITVPAKSSKVFSLKNRNGWSPLGFIVVLYSVSPGPLSIDPTTGIEAAMASYVFSRQEEFDIRGASLLIPPLLMNYWMKGYIVFGQTVKINNNQNRDLQALIVPIYYKEAGTWTPNGLVVKVSKADIGSAYSAYIVVQVPAIARISSIVLPSGQVIQNVENYTTGWLGTWRTAVLEKNEATIMVKNGDAMEDGTYVFNINWAPLTLKFVDSKGYPISGVKVHVEGPVSLDTLSGADGIAKINIYAPGVYKITGAFKGVDIASITLGTLMDQDIVLKCPVYNLRVKVVTALGNTLTGATVTITNDGGYSQSMETDANGIAVFQQLPTTKYTIEANYKRISTKTTITLTGDQEVTVNTGILLDIPLLGPITAVEALAAGAATMVAGALLSGVKRGKDKEEVEIELD